MRKFFSFFITLCLLICLIPVVSNVDAASVTRYGYTQLTNDYQRAAYNAIVAGVDALQYEIRFSVSGITQNNFQTVLADVKTGCAMVTKDYPEFFWFDGAVKIDITSSEVIICPKAYMVEGKKINSASELKPYKVKFDTAVSKALAKIKGNFSDYEIAHTFHDYVVENVTYAAVGDHQSAYGALVSGKAVCAGYTRAYQILLNKAGIPSFYVSGTSYGPDGKIIGHAWNLVWLDGNCFYSDTTWDDQSKDLFHEHLNMSLEDISKTHFTEDPVPKKCGHDHYTYFANHDTDHGVCDFHGHKTIEEVAGCFELKSQSGDIATYYCTIHYHGESFTVWFDHVKLSLINALGLTGSVQYQIIELGLEHHVTLTGKVAPQSTPVNPTPPSNQTGNSQTNNNQTQIGGSQTGSSQLGNTQTGNAQTNTQATQPPVSSGTLPSTQPATEPTTLGANDATSGSEPVDTQHGATQGNTEQITTEGVQNDTVPDSLEGDKSSGNGGVVAVMVSVAAAAVGGGIFYFLKRKDA